MSELTDDEVNGVWVVIPAFHESSVIRAVVDDMQGMFQNVVVVDDGSTDETSQQASEGGAHVIRHPVNLGQGAALQTGIDYALARGAKYIATFDADGQHQPEDVLEMLDLIRTQEVDVVLGSRFLGTVYGMPRGRRVLLRAAVWFTRLTTGLALTDAHNGLRLFTRNAAQTIHLSHNRMAHASEIIEQIASNQLKYAEVGITVRYTEYSRSKGQKASNAINIIVDLFFGRLRK